MHKSKVYGYFAYYDSSSATASNRKYKYAATSGVDDTQLREGKGYWLNARQAGTLTLPSVGGTLNTSTYAWSKLRFHNGTDEMNVTQAVSEGWINQTLQTWGDTGSTDKQGNPIINWVSVSDESGHQNSLNSWQGYFIKSYYNNIVLIRQN